MRHVNKMLNHEQAGNLDYNCITGWCWGLGGWKFKAKSLPEDFAEFLGTCMGEPGSISAAQVYVFGHWDAAMVLETTWGVLCITA